jgi:hypothetical protein
MKVFIVPVSGASGEKKWSENRMDFKKISVVLLAFLLAAMAMVAVVNAEPGLSENAVIQSKYFQNVPLTDDLRNTVASDSREIFSSLSEYSLVTVNPESFADDAENENQVTFRVKETNYVIHLKPVATPVAKNAKITMKNPDGEKIIDLPLIKTYAGKIDGENSANALFTVSDGVLLGKFSIGNETYYIDQCGRTESGKIVHIIYNSAKAIKRGTPRKFDVVIRDESLEGNSPSDQIPAVIPEKIDSERSIVTANGVKLSATNVGLMAVYDTQFSSAYPNSAAEISNMISQVNTAFSPADVSLTITSYYQDSTLTSTIAYPLLCDFRTNYQDERDQTNSDLAFLFTGKQLGNDVGGAFQYNGNSANAYGLAQMVSDGGVFSGSSYQRDVLITHEIGHNFGADHENGSSSPTWARAYHWVEWWVINKYTAMWSLWQGNDGQIEFSNSNNHGDSTHNNIQRIRDTRSVVAGFQ